MQAREAEGQLVGTFDGSTGDQFAAILSKVDVLVDRGEPPADSIQTQTGSDLGSSEKTVELTLRAQKPVDETRVQVELPAHGARELVDQLEKSLNE